MVSYQNNSITFPAYIHIGKNLRRAFQEESLCGGMLYPIRGNELGRGSVNPEGKNHRRTRKSSGIGHLESGSRDQVAPHLVRNNVGLSSRNKRHFFAAEGRDQRGAICLENARMNRFALISPLPSLRSVGRNDKFRIPVSFLREGEEEVSPTVFRHNSVSDQRRFANFFSHQSQDSPASSTIARAHSSGWVNMTPWPALIDRMVGLFRRSVNSGWKRSGWIAKSSSRTITLVGGSSA
jgi:hypothetical protein